MIQLEERRSIKVHHPASLSKPMQIAFAICSNILIQRECNCLLRPGNDLPNPLSVQVFGSSIFIGLRIVFFSGICFSFLPNIQPHHQRSVAHPERCCAAPGGVHCFLLLEQQTLASRGLFPLWVSHWFPVYGWPSCWLCCCPGLPIPFFFKQQ
jgi:hypothetical protein